MPSASLSPKVAHLVAGALLAVLYAPCLAGSPQPVELANPSFVADAAGELPGWFKTEHASGNSYTFVADPQSPLSKPSSLRINRHGGEAFGLLQQRVKTQPAWAGRTVRLSGSLKTKGAVGPGGALVLQARTLSDAILVHDHMDDHRRLRGDQDWKKVSVQVKLPPTTGQLLVGVMLEEAGTLWADDLVLEVID
ncbi:MAG: hypothetical protein ABIR26_12775 [Ramlibacter sp.]